MWQAHPVGWLARKYAVEEERRPLAELDFGSWRECSAITLRGERLKIMREGWWNPRFHLERDRMRLCSAYRPSVFRSTFTIEHDGERYTLMPGSWLGSSSQLLRDRRRLGNVVPLGFLQRRLQVGFDDELALELRLFALWLVILARRRGATGAAAS